VEARLAGGGLNSDPPYSDNASFNDSTLKSTAAGLTGTGSRYAVSGTPAFSVRPSLAVAGGTYDVSVTQGSAGSISDDLVVAVSQTGCAGLPATTTIFRESGGNTWELLGRMTLNAGVSVPTLTFTYSSGTLNANGNGRMYSDATKYVFIPPPQPPTITNQPVGKAVNQGANASFSVGVTGATPLSFQWRFEGTNLAGATQSAYTRSNAQAAHEGDYEVVVTNVAGSVTSSVAFLTVNLPPYIGAQPAQQSVWRGQDATFFVTAGGTEPFRYQWRFNGANLAGATESSYTRASAQTNHAGNYSVIITNIAGAITSANAALTVTVPPPPVLQAIASLPDGRLRLALSGTVDAPFAIDASSNLAGWFELMSGILSNSPTELVDDSATNSTPRFYRARQ